MSLKTNRERERAIDVQYVLWAYDGNRKLDLGILPQDSLSCLVILCKPPYISSHVAQDLMENWVNKNVKNPSMQQRLLQSQASQGK